MDAADFREGAGRLCLDFVRTDRRRGHPDRTEELPDRPALAAWLTRFGPVPVHVAEVTDDDVNRTRAVRDAVRETLEATRTGGPAPRDAVVTLNRAAAVPPPSPRLHRDGTVTFFCTAPATAVLSVLARDALDLVGSGVVEKLKNCANPACGALFLDNSRPGRRRWCSMDSCGNRAKQETYRRRGAAASA